MYWAGGDSGIWPAGNKCRDRPEGVPLLGAGAACLNLHRRRSAEHGRVETRLGSRSDYAQPQLPPQQEPPPALKSGMGPQAGSDEEPDRATAAITGTCRFTLVELQLEQNLPVSAEEKLVNFSKLSPQLKHL